MIVHYIRVAGFLQMSWSHIYDGWVRDIFIFFQQVLSEYLLFAMLQL